MTTATRWVRLSTGLAALALAAACGDGTGPAASRNNPGTGTGTLSVTADIDAVDVPNTSTFTTEFAVTLADGLGNPVSGATVTVQNAVFGTVTLPETGLGTGDYFNTRSGFPAGDFRLDVVRGTDNVRGVILGGPGVHTITTPIQNGTAVAGQPMTVRWTVPSQGQSAEIETRNYGPVSTPDDGDFAIPGASNPARTDQRVRVFRFNEVSIAGGLPGSRLRVEVRRTVEPIIVQ